MCCGRADRKTPVEPGGVGFGGYVAASDDSSPSSNKRLRTDTRRQEIGRCAGCERKWELAGAVGPRKDLAVRRTIAAEVGYIGMRSAWMLMRRHVVGNTCHDRRHQKEMRLALLCIARASLIAEPVGPGRPH